MLRSWWGVGAAVLALLLAYYGLPVEADGGGVAVGLLLTALGLGVLGWAIVVQVRHEQNGVRHARLATLLIMLCLVVVLFALTYYIVERQHPGQIADLHTRTDALYFTLSTLATIGFGDVHASGQAARALVSVQIVFNLVFVAALVRSITTELREGHESPRG